MPSYIPSTGNRGSSDRHRVLILTASVGEGHNRAAAELAHRLRVQGTEVQVRDFLDALPPGGRLLLQRGYTAAVQHFPRAYHRLFFALERRGWSFRLARLLAWSAAFRIRRWARDADAVVSTYPLASQALGGLARAGRVAVPAITYLTDPAVHALWISRGIDRHLTVLPITAAECRERYNTPATAVGALVPMMADASEPGAAAHLRRDIGVPADSPIALLAAGSLGLGRLVAAEALANSGVATPVVLCGHNVELRRRLQRLPGVVALGWREDVPALLRLADVFVHNAGGMSFTESMVAGVPAVTFDCIAGHGQANGEVLASAGIAPLARTPAELVDAVRRQLAAPARALVPATQDASAVVLQEIAAGRATSRAACHRRRPRRLPRLATAAAVLLTVWLGATEGVNAAVAEGVGVSTLAPGTASLVVRVPSAAALTAPEVARLRALRATVLPVGAAPRPRWVKAMTDRGLMVAASECPDDALAQAAGRCGLEQSPPAGGTPVLVVGTHGADATDLLAAERHVLTLIRAHPISSIVDCPTGIGIVDIHQLAGPSAVAALQQHCAARHVRLVAVTQARQPQ